MNKRVTIIINPAAGKKDSILWSINNAFGKKAISWDVQITHEKGDAYRFAQKAAQKKEPIVAVYGGDGTIAEAAKALYKTDSALCILPGGTANIFAKELKISTDIDEALGVLAQNIHKIRTIDMVHLRSPDEAGLQNELFVLRIEAGLSALVIKKTKRSTKRLFGLLSYLIHFLPHLPKSQLHTFKLDIDGQKVSLQGVALMVINVGNIGVEGYSVVPQSEVDDGMLDVVFFGEKSVGSFFVWLKSLITGKKPEGSIRHWKAKKVQVILDRKQSIISDDKVIALQTIEAEIIPKALKVVVA